MRPDNPIVMLVDDCEDDVLLMCIAAKRAGILEPLRLAADGEDAIAYLDGAGRYKDRGLFPLPTILLLDLNMPGRSGFEVLEWIREHVVHEHLRVYVLSASSREEDIARAYLLGASSYLVKPTTLDGLVRIAKSLIAGHAQVDAISCRSA